MQNETTGYVQTVDKFGNPTPLSRLPLYPYPWGDPQPNESNIGWSISSAQSMPRADPELSAISQIDAVLTNFIEKVREDKSTGEFFFTRVQRILDYFSDRYGASREE